MRHRDDCATEVPVTTADDVLTPDECADLINLIRTGDWHPSAQINDDTPLITSGPDASDAGIDQDAVARLDDPRLALRLYHRIASLLPEELEDRTLIGLKPMMHCLRYATGHSSSLHTDHAYEAGDDQRSELTLLIYLNDDFEGGETDFPTQAERIEPQAGRAVLFRHGTQHRGATVEHGTKYVLRTEVYYAPERGRAG